jgi:hypothetical protein
MARQQPRNVTRDEELRAIDAAIAAGRIWRITLDEALAYDEAKRDAYARGQAARLWRWYSRNLPAARA